MKIAVDLHIHTGLSPCADNSMTPHNIINMALLKKLNAIAITDHNTTGNLENFMKVADHYPIICIPGIEITTKEEVHLIVLFEGINDAKQFQKIIDDKLPKVKNNKHLFGEQLLYDEGDQVIKEYEYFLLGALQLSLEQVIEKVKEIGGVCIPAHVDRPNNSILSNLGFIPPQLEINAIEYSKSCDIKMFNSVHKNLEGYGHIQSSDAHRLGDILERVFFLDVLDLNTAGVLNSIKSGQGAKPNN
ncbi:PHP C-terminal domain protein [Alkaliphilus metalliredigens QYMF]|uniref:PHP C-terminal domain protein n=1 Tax=Alkaliphilus metalliredigens (strain QYMF) TaxID=293826 RepID=A6TQG7_ALKMQ|nr:PHP domain-containing protein [Alkaliphilus metalliredigens]ABR48435.1 PHP C-terminal domain protein [Alkaliphilus metalliredigens QYMF]